MKKEHTKQSEELYAEIGRLTTQLAWLKKMLHRNLSSKMVYYSRDNCLRNGRFGPLPFPLFF